MSILKISLAAARVNKNLTQDEACKKIGVSKNTLIAWEKGKRIPNPEFIQKIEKLYDVEYNDIIFFINK